MKKVLIISDICLSDNYMAGNKNALLSLLDYFGSLSDVQVDLLNFHHNRPECDLPNNFRIIHRPDYINLVKRKAYSFIGRQKSLLKYKKSIYRSFFTYIVSYFDTYDIVIIEYLENHHLRKFFSSGNAKVICDIHDVMSLRKNSFTKAGKLPKLENLDIELEDEIFALNQFDAVIAIEENEAKFLSHRTDFTNIILCKRTLFPNVELPSRSVSSPKDLVLGFIGSRAEFNRDVFFNYILPVWNDCLSGLGFKLVIAGAICDVLKDGISAIDGDVEVLGKLDDLKEFYEIIDVSLNPIWAGSGFKTKNAEALSYGKPVITTALGAMGFEGVDDKYVMTISNSSHTSWVSILDILFYAYVKDKNYNSNCHAEFNRVFGRKENYQQLNNYMS